MSHARVGTQKHHASQLTTETHFISAKPKNPNERSKVMTGAENTLRYFLRTYDSLSKNITATKLRLQSILPDADPMDHPEVQDMEKLKGKLSRRIDKELELYPIWTEWMKEIGGIGPFIAGNLIMLYYFRHIALCKKCGADLVDFKCPACEWTASGSGLLTFRIEEKDFPNISKWWKYMGVHCGEDGSKPKRQKGVKQDWSTIGRNIAWHIGENINKQKPDNLYKGFYLMRKDKREKTHPKASKGHRHNMAKNETAKLFLAHFWIAARTIDAKTVTEPYAGTIMGHTGIIDPFYYEGEIKYSNRLKAA